MRIPWLLWSTKTTDSNENLLGEIFLNSSFTITYLDEKRFYTNVQLQNMKLPSSIDEDPASLGQIFCPKIWSVPYPVASWHWTCSHIHIVLTSTQQVDNVIPTKERYVVFRYTLRVVVIKTARNIKIFRTRVFPIGSGRNQSYSWKYGLEFISPS